MEPPCFRWCWVIIPGCFRSVTLSQTQPTHRCGCGAKVAHCPFWTQVGAISPRPQLFALSNLNQAATIISAVAALRLGKTIRYGQFAEAFDHQLAVCRKFVDFDIFIDGFKSISRYGALKAAGFPVRGVIHLLRDPRSFASSAKRKHVPVEEAAAQWSSIHAAIVRMTRLLSERVIQVHYEEFCASPAQQLARLQAWMGLEQEALLHPFSPGRHWVGNRTMREFDGTIALRESWRETLSRSELGEIERACGSDALAWSYDLSLEGRPGLRSE